MMQAVSTRVPAAVAVPYTDQTTMMSIQACAPYEGKACNAHEADDRHDDAEDDAQQSSCTLSSRHQLQHHGVCRHRHGKEPVSQRYSPYAQAAASAGGGSAAGATAKAAAGRRRELLQLTISAANAALESTLRHFDAALNANAGSAAALTALDAAEAAMARTTRLTSLASALAGGMLDGSGAADHCIPSAADIVAVVKTRLAGLAGAPRHEVLLLPELPAAMPQLLHDASEDVEDGEEVSSSLACPTHSATTTTAAGASMSASSGVTAAALASPVTAGA